MSVRLETNQVINNRHNDLPRRFTCIVVVEIRKFKRKCFKFSDYTIVDSNQLIDHLHANNGYYRSNSP